MTVIEFERPGEGAVADEILITTARALERIVLNLPKLIAQIRERPRHNEKLDRALRLGRALALAAEAYASLVEENTLNSHSAMVRPVRQIPVRRPEPQVQDWWLGENGGVKEG